MNTEEKKGTLVVLACHGVFDPQLNAFHAEHPEDTPVYESQIAYAFRHLVWRSAVSPLLVVSGGFTKIQRYCSESRSYLELARMLGLDIPMNVALEEYALTSIENLLLSLYVYHQIKKIYPESIDVISWEFKRARFAQTLTSISNWDNPDWKNLGLSWPSLDFFPVGDLWGNARNRAVADENKYIEELKKGVRAYYLSTQTQEVLAKRDVHMSRNLARKYYEGYPLPW
jgi:hypothetical protein